MTAAEGDSREHTIRLLIVDDQPLIRRGLAMMLSAESGLEVVGVAADGLDAIDQALATEPDVIIMDLQMPRASGVVATREITARLPGARIVVLSTFDDDELVFEAIRAGAQAYLLKDASEADVLETIRSVHRGESRLSPSIARKVMEQFRTLVPRPSVTLTDDSEPANLARSITASTTDWNPPTDSTVSSVRDEALTDKESRILDLLAQGMSNKQIASAVFLAEGTVKNYVSRIMDKLHASSRLELAVRVVTRRS